MQDDIPNGQLFRATCPLERAPGHVFYKKMTENVVFRITKPRGLIFQPTWVANYDWLDYEPLEIGEIV